MSTDPFFPHQNKLYEHSPEHPRTGEPEHPRTGEPEHPRTGEPEHTRTGEPEHPRTGEPEHPRTGEPGIGETGNPSNPTTTETKPPDITTGDPSSDTSTGSSDKAGELLKELKAVTDKLDNLSERSQGKVRTTIDKNLSVKTPGEVWSLAQVGFFEKVEDKELAEKIKAIFSEKFGKDLGAWNDLIKGDLIDPKKLIEINLKLEKTITSYDKQLEVNRPNGNDGMMVQFLREALDAISGKISTDTNLAVQRGAFEPLMALTHVTADLDKLSEKGKGVVITRNGQESPRKKFDTQLKTKQPDEVWSSVKDKIFSKMEDKKLMKKIKEVFSENFGKDLVTWSDLIKGDLIDPKKLIEINRKLADTITIYDKQLSGYENSLGLEGAQWTGGFRECLYAISGKISSETKLSVERGAFDPIKAVKAVTDDLDKLSRFSQVQSTRKKIDDALRNKPYEAVWSDVKKDYFSKMEDKALVKKAKDIFSDNFGKDLGSRKKYMTPPIDLGKLIKINRKLVDTITGYDKQLAALEQGNLGKDGLYISGLREGLFAIAGRLSHDAKYMANTVQSDPAQ